VSSISLGNSEIQCKTHTSVLYHPRGKGLGYLFNHFHQPFIKGYYQVALMSWFFGLLWSKLAQLARESPQAKMQLLAYNEIVKAEETWVGS
jgi:hypothetical protein